MNALRPTIVRATAQPRLLSSGVATTVRMAGGGDRCPYRFGGVDYRSGLANVPRFKAQIGWDEKGWTGGVAPTQASLDWFPSTALAFVDFANNYLWKGASITVEVGDEGAGGAEPTAWTAVLTGTVEKVDSADGGFTLTISDLSSKLDKPAAPNVFAGTGGTEGPAEAKGRPKRRNWGKVHNVELRVLDKVNSIYEFGDPAFQSTIVHAVRDMGRDGDPAPTVLAWAGSVAATFAALQAATVVAGTAVVAPSIQCVKWWTTPASVLTADITGEVAGPAGTVAQAMLASLGGGLTISNTERDSLNAQRSGNCAIHIADDRQTIAQTLDALFLGVSTIWVADSAGTVSLRPITFSNVVASLRSEAVAREGVFAPHKSRKLGYKRNHRQHNDGEISAVFEGLAGDSNRVRFSMFEKAALGWKNYGVTSPATGGTLLITTTTSYSYVRQVPVFTAVAGQSAELGTDYADTNYRIPVTAGERVWASARFNPTLTAGHNYTLYVGFLDSTGAGMAGETVTVGSSTATGWARLGGFLTVPAGAFSAYLLVRTRNNGIAGSSSQRVAEPMIVSAGLNQVYEPPFTPGPSNENGADVTATVVGPSSSNVQYDYLGTTFQDSDDLEYRVQTSAGTALSGVTMKYKVVSGTFNGLTSTSAVQTLTVTSGAATVTPTSLGTDTAEIEITATLNGRALPALKTKLTKIRAAAPAAPPAGSSNPSSQTSGFTPINTATPTAITGILSFAMPAGKTNLRCVIDLAPKFPKIANQKGPWNVAYKVQREIAAVYTDQGAVFNSAPDPFIDSVLMDEGDGTYTMEIAQAGVMQGTRDMTVSASTTYNIKVLAYITSGTLPTNGSVMSFTGSVTLSAP